MRKRIVAGILAVLMLFSNTSMSVAAETVSENGINTAVEVKEEATEDSILEKEIDTEAVVEVETELVSVSENDIEETVSANEINAEMLRSTTESYLMDTKVPYDGDYLLVANTNTDENGTNEYTGIFPASSSVALFSDNAGENIFGDISGDIYGYDKWGRGLIDPASFLPEPVLDIAYSENNIAPLKATTISEVEYAVGDTKTFYLDNDKTAQYKAVTCVCAAVGTYSSVWIPADDSIYLNNADLMRNYMSTLAAEFDSQYPKMIEMFGDVSTVDRLYGDGDGKTALVCYDIDGDGEGTASSYVGGYFFAADLDFPFSNTTGSKCDLLHIDSWQGMYRDTENNILKDVTASKGTIVHEFQHMINFAVNRANDPSLYTINTPAYLNEAYSMAAEHLCYGADECYNRVWYYNKYPYITNGNVSLMRWGAYDTLSNYSLSYLFGQYIRTQYKNGDTIYRDSMNQYDNSSENLLTIIAELLGVTENELLLNFRAALFQKNAEGPCGFQGEEWAEAIGQQMTTVEAIGEAAYLYPGAAVVVPMGGSYIPSGAGENISFAGMYLELTDEDVEVTISGDTSITKEDGELQLSASVYPEGVSQSVIFTLPNESDRAYATVTTDGLVTALANGCVTIRATSVYNPNKYADITITISGQNRVGLKKTEEVLDEGYRIKYTATAPTTAKLYYTYSFVEPYANGNLQDIDPDMVADPTAESDLFPASGLELTDAGSYMIKVIGIADGYKSSVVTSIYKVAETTMPTIWEEENEDGTYTVTIKAEEGATIAYTLDGSDPVRPATEETLYTGPFQVTTPGWVYINAIAYKPGNITSGVGYKPLEVPVATPQIIEEDVLGGKEVTIETATEGAKIHYTLDGREPSAESPLYTDTLLFDKEAATVIKAVAIVDESLVSNLEEGDEYNTSSEITSKTITVGKTKTVVSSQSKKILEEGEVISLYSATSGAYIYYTLDGSEPSESESSSLYTNYLTMAEEKMQIRAYARSFGNVDSDVVEFVYDSIKQVYLYGDDNRIGRYLTVSEAVEALKTDAESNDRQVYRIVLGADADMGDADMILPESAAYCELDLNEHTLTAKNGLVLALDKVHNGTFYVTSENSVYIYAPENNAEEALYENLKFDFEQAKGGFYVYSEQYDTVEGNATPKTAIQFKNIQVSDNESTELNGIVHMDEKSVLTTTKLSLNNTYEDTTNRLLGTVTADNASMTKGTFDIGSLAIVGDVEINTDLVLNIRGTASFGNVCLYEQDNCQSRYVYFNVVQLLNGDGTVKCTGTITFNGRIADHPVDMTRGCQISFGKKQIIVSTDGTESDSETAKFNTGEIIAMIEKETGVIPTEYFTLTESDEKIIRSGNNLLAVCITVEVSLYDETIGGVIKKEYVTLEDAVANLDADFGGKTGSYAVTLINDYKLSANITIPDFVTELHLKAEGKDTPNELLMLDLGGYSISTSGVVTLYNDLCLTNTTEAVSKFTTTAKNGADGFAVKIIGEADAENVEHLSNLSIMVSNGTVLFESADTENFHNADVAVTAKEVLVNYGKWKLGTLTVSNFINNAVTDVIKLNNIQNLDNKAGGILIVDNYTQKTNGITNLESDSKLLIKSYAKIYNTVIGGETGEGTLPVYVYRMSDYADKNGADQNASCTVAFEGKVTSTNDILQIAFGILIPEADAEGIIDGDGSLSESKPRTKLFTTAIKTFPIELFTVNQSGENPAYTEVYQQDNNIYVGREWITISTKQVDGSQEELKSFVRWQDAAAFIETLANTPMEYVVEIGEDVEMYTDLTLPKKVSGITFRGVDTDLKDNNNRITLTYTGDIRLASNTTFENIDLVAKKYDSKIKDYVDYQSTVTLNGMTLIMKNSSASYASISGNNMSKFVMESARVEVAKAVTSLGCLDMTGVADISKTGVVTVDTILSADNVTVTDTLTMQSAKLDCVNKIALKNIVTKDAYNALSYGGNTSKDGLTISGSITSIDMADETVIVSRIETTSNGTAGVNKQALARKNAIELQIKSMESAGYTNEALLCTAEKAGAGWFVVGSNWKTLDDEMTRVIFYGTYKVKNKEIHCGEIEENVKLYSSDSGEAGTYSYESGFVTLQDALTEIDKLAVNDAYYRIELVSAEENVVTFNTKAPSFPSKTKGIIIAGDNKLASPYFYFKGNLTFKSDTTFEDMVFVPQTTSSISLGNYELRLERCYVDISRSGVEFSGITGSGVNGTSALILDDTVLAVAGNVNNIAKLVFTGEAATEPSSFIATFSLLRSTPAYPELIADGTVNVGSIELEKDGYLTGSATVARSKGTVTKVTPQITINKDVYSMEGHALYLDLQEKVSNQFVMLDFNNDEMTNILKSGISLAKALYVTYPNVKAAQRNNEASLVKSGSYLTYFADGFGVVLSFEGMVTAEDGTTKRQTIQIPCRTFADAVTEINNQKTKRDYTIFLQPVITEISGADQSGAVPKALTMPNRNCVDTLTIQAPKNNDAVKLGFINNITLTCNVVLENVQFVQMMKVGSVYQTSDIAKDHYPGAVNFNTAGFEVTIKGENTFNTPLVVNGSNKTVLTFDENGTITTFTNNYDGLNSSSVTENVIYGSLTSIDEVNVNDCNLTLCAYKTSPLATSYTESKNKITTVNVAGMVTNKDGVNETAGNITVVSPASKGEFTATNYNSNDGKLSVDGKVNLKNVTLEGDYNAAIHADTNFDITGNLISRSNRAVLETRLKGAGKEPYLNISGTVVRVGDTIAIEVTVYPEITAIDTETPVNLKNTSGSKVQLLAAKNAQSADFKLRDGNYPGGEYSAEEPVNAEGYMLLKESGKIFVHNGEKVNLAVYKGDYTGANTSELLGYYPSFKEATTDVDALKDKTQEYTYVLTKTNGTLSAPVSVTLPTQAESVTVTRLASASRNETIYVSGNISLKCDTSFENIELAPTSRGVGTAFSIVDGGYDVILQDVTVSTESDKMALKDISGNGKGHVTLDSPALEMTGAITNATELIILEDTLIKGNVKAATLSFYNSDSAENAGVTLAVNGTVTVDMLQNNGTAQNTLEYSRNTSNKNSNLTINKDVVNEINDNPVLLKQQDVYSLTALTKAGAKVTLSNASKALTLPNASTDSFILDAKCITADGQEITFAGSGEGYTVVKADKGIYIADSTLENDIVSLIRTKTETQTDANTGIVVEGEMEPSVTNCLDYSQAVNEINTLADGQYMQYSYVIQFLAAGTEAKGNRAIDTNVKDTNPYGTFTLPKSNAKKNLVIKGVENGTTIVPFSGNISGQGTVTLQNLILNPVKSGTDSTPADTKISITADKTTPQLTLVNVSTNEQNAADAKSTGFIASIGGSSNKTDVSLVDCEGLIVKSGITNINTVSLDNTKLLSDGTVTVNTVRLLNNSTWDSLGKMTVTDVKVSIPTVGVTTSYIGIKQDKNSNSQFVVNGDVYGATMNDGAEEIINNAILLCKVYTIDTTIADADEIFALTSETKFEKEPAQYAGVSLVSAKKASADKFRAFDFRADSEDGSIVDNNENITKDNLVAYKDGVSVKNGNMNAMQIKLIERNQTADGTILSTSYAVTFEDAVTTINNKADMKAYYDIQFIKAGIQQDSVVIKTTKKGTEYGALTLPSKAAGVTISGYTSEIQNEAFPCTVIKYTGTLKAFCDVTFENILLTEGKIDKNAPDGFAENGTITPTPANNVSIAFKENVYTYQNSVTENINAGSGLIVNAINAGKGKLIFHGNAVSTEKTINIGSLVLLDGASLESVGKVTITDLIADASETNSLSSEAAISIGNIKNQNIDEGAEPANVKIKSDFTKITKVGTFGNSQLTISGKIENVNVKLNYRKYILTNKIYADMEQSDYEKLLMQTDGKPNGYKKLATVPKASLDWITVVESENSSVVYGEYDYNNSETQTYLYKYETGLYLTDLRPLALVSGYSASADSENAYTNENLCYQAEFLSWDQAVKEIEKINDKTCYYELKLLDTIGYNKEDQKVYSPIGTLTMPSKAAEVLITSEAGEKNGIFFTGTNVALKCPVRMENVGFTCVKKQGSGSNISYQPITYTMNIGNFKLAQKDMVNSFGEVNTVVYTVSGSTNGIFELVSDTPDSRRKFATIKGMNELIVEYTSSQLEDAGYENFIVDCSGDISVKNLIVNNSTVEAKNITVSTLVALDEAALQAGTSVANDGKMTLKDIALADNGNALRAEQNKNGVTQLTINGTVTAAADATDDALSDGTLEIALYYNNYKKGNNYQKPAQLYNGMILCVAQKVASSLFVPDYTGVTVTEIGMGIKTDTHGIYKSGKNICYGKIEGNREVQLSIGDSGMTTCFASFEEAVKEIDSLSLYKDPTVKTKEYEDYTITLLSDVEIGNTKKNYSFSSLSLPAKAKELTIDGNPNEDNDNTGYTLSFNSNVSIGCNTKFTDIALYPIKNVKGAGVKTAVNYSIGNYTLELDNTISQDESGMSLIGNVSGSSKTGTLKLAAGAEGQQNDISISQLTGLREVVLEEYTHLHVDKTCSVYQLTFHNSTLDEESVGEAAVQEVPYVEETGLPVLSVDGALTTTLINAENAGAADDVYGIIRKPIASKMTVNGLYEDRDKDKVKECYALLFPTGLENGCIQIDVSGTPCPAGTLILTGKYLNWNKVGDNIKVVNINEILKTNSECITYSKGTNLYVGGKTE